MEANTTAPAPIDLPDESGFRDHIATVDEQGRRNWIYPKKPSGPYYKYRTYLSWVLLAILFGLPFIKVAGEPFVLLNVLERRFILFGFPFSTQDFHLFALSMIAGMLFIVLFTVVFGRLFCGWVCPQTIFMEMVFRKIEYWIEGDANQQRKLNKAPWTTEKVLKKSGKQLIFILISVAIAHTFLSYIIGLDDLVELISQPPWQQPAGFIAMVVFTGAFYFVFSRMREQVCIAICPYGRLQGVLLDKNSISVMYDWVRGEPRGKMKRQKQKKAAKKDCSDGCGNCQSGLACEETATPLPVLGDCVDCNLCVQVCPTGIDIRNGTQLECVNCTACMDACDEVMEKIGREKGLIRYDSYNGIVDQKRKLITSRVKAYSLVLVGLVSLIGFLLFQRTEVEVLLLRTPGMLYQQNDDGTIGNLYNYQIINKTRESMPIEFRLVDESGTIRLVGRPPAAAGNEVTEGALFIDLPRQQSPKGKRTVRVEVWSEDQRIDVVKTSFLQPRN